MSENLVPPERRVEIGVPTRAYALGSRRRDLAAFLAPLLVAVAGAPALLVYHRVTVVEVSLVRVDPDGSRDTLALPAAVWNEGRRARAARRTPEEALRHIEGDIRRFVDDAPAETLGPPGARLEWLVRYSENSTRLDRRARFVVPVP